MQRRKYVLIALCFILIKLFTWGFGYALAIIYPIDSRNYFTNFHHLRPDGRVVSGKVSFFSLWNYADSEWYLSIARDGYPATARMRSDLDSPSSFRSTVKESFMRYAFFPLYPLIISAFTAFFSLEVAAFVSTLLINVLAVCALVYFMEQYFPDADAVWPFLLLFLFPFSVFYSLYFTEALFLLLSLLVFISVKSRNYIVMALSGLLLTLTRPNGVLIMLPVLVALVRGKEKKILPYIVTFVIPAGLLFYFLFGYLQTGNGNFYFEVNRWWGTDRSGIMSHLFGHLRSVFKIAGLRLHTFHESKIDTLVMLFFGIMLAIMWRKKFPLELTLWSALLWLFPLVFKKDLMSFSRYMSVSFPVFVFLGAVDKRTKYLLLALFGVGYCLALRVVIQYGWLG